MSYNNFKNNSYCVVGKHYSPTINIYGDATNTGISMGRPVKILRGNCMIWSRNKSLIVSDRTINAEGLGDFFKHLGSAAKNVGKKILNNPGRALEIAATAPDVIKFVHQGKGLYKAEGLSSKGSKAGNASGSKASNTGSKARTNGKGLYHIKNGIYSEYQIQTNDSYCAAYCLYTLYLTNKIGFKNAVLNLYYQTFKLNK